MRINEIIYIILSLFYTFHKNCMFRHNYWKSNTFDKKKAEKQIKFFIILLKT